MAQKLIFNTWFPIAEFPNDLPNGEDFLPVQQEHDCQLLVYVPEGRDSDSNPAGIFIGFPHPWSPLRSTAWTISSYDLGDDTFQSSEVDTSEIKSYMWLKGPR